MERMRRGNQGQQGGWSDHSSKQTHFGANRGQGYQGGQNQGRGGW